MEDGKSSPRLLLPKYKQRRVSAVRDFPKGLKRSPDFVDLLSTSGQAFGLQDEYLKATGLNDISCCHDTRSRKRGRVVDFEDEGVLQLSIKKQRGVAVKEVIHDNVEGSKLFSEDTDPKTKGDESCGSKNENLSTKSSEELDAKLKGDEGCGSKKLYEASIAYESGVDFERGVLQFGTTQHCGNGDKTTAHGLRKKPLRQMPGDFSNSVNHVIDDVVKSLREETRLDFEQEVDHFSCIQQRCVYDNCNPLGSKESINCQDIGSSLNLCNLQGSHHRKLPKRRKVSAIRDFPPALVQVIPLNPIHRNTEMCDSTTNNLSAMGHGYKKSEETDVENEKDSDFPKIDDCSHSNANERKESSFNSGEELLVDKVASTNHSGIVERSCSDIVCSSDGANVLEPKYGINIVKANVENRFLSNDEQCLEIENQELHHPSVRNSPLIDDVQESIYKLDAPDDMFFLAPADAADFFSDDCHNGFLFEDYVEPSETISQSAWQDGSADVLETARELETMDHGIKEIADSDDDGRRLQPNYVRNEASKTNKLSISAKLSISGKRKEDVCSLFIPQKNPSCKKANGFFQHRFPTVGGSVSKDKPKEYRTGEVPDKKVQPEVIKLEGGGCRVGKVKYMPQTEACKALEKGNNSLPAKIYTKDSMCSASEKTAERVVVQGLMAAKMCPWRHKK